MDTAVLRDDAAGLSSVTKKTKIPEKRRVIVDTAVISDDQKALTSVTHPEFPDERPTQRESEAYQQFCKRMAKQGSQATENPCPSRN